MVGDYAAPTAKAGHHGMGLKLVRESEREPDIEAIESLLSYSHNQNEVLEKNHWAMVNRLDHNPSCILGCGLDVEWTKEIPPSDPIFLLELKEAEWPDPLPAHGYYPEMLEQGCNFLVGLILQQTGRQRGEYRRVGIYRCYQPFRDRVLLPEI